MKRAPLCDSTGEGVCRGYREGLPIVGLFFLVGSPVEWRPGGLESGLYPLPLASGSVLNLSFSFPGGRHGYDPHPGHKEPEVLRSGMTNAKVAQ